MNRRQALKIGAGGGALLVIGGFGPPACDGVSKDKAVKYAGIAVDYLKDALPLVSQLGGTEMVNLINKAVPLLEKLKSALDNNDFPTAGNFFDTVTGVLGQVANALLQLPDSPRRATIMGIITLVNLTLRTVSLFIDSETPATGPRRAALPGGIARAATPDAIRRAFEATRF